MKKTLDKAQKTYQKASESYDKALNAYNNRNHGLAIELIQDAAKYLELTFRQASYPIPAEWQRFSEALSDFKLRLDTVIDIREAIQGGTQPVSELVIELRAIMGECGDQAPVLSDFLKDLTQQAVEECMQQADKAEKEGYDQRAQEYLHIALELGDKAVGVPKQELQSRLDTLTKRQERIEQIKHLNDYIRVLRGQSGRLHEVSNYQTELLHLMVEDTGKDVWIKAVEEIIQAIPTDWWPIHRDMLEDAMNGEVDLIDLKRSRTAYQDFLYDAETKIYFLEDLIEDQDLRGRRIVDEARNWLRSKKRLIDYNVATSAGGLKDHIGAVKSLKRLRDDIQPGEYDYSVEFHNARQAMLDDVLLSANKRRVNAEELMEQGQYDLAIDQLHDIEDDFYGPVEEEFPELHARLSEKFTPLGDLRGEVNALLRTVERRRRIAVTLQEKENQAMQLWHQVMPPSDLDIQEKEAILSDALSVLQSARLDDPEEECRFALKRIDKLEDQIQSALRDERRHYVRRIINQAERRLRIAKIESDLQAIHELLDSIDPTLLDIEYKARYANIYDQIMKRRDLGERLEVADQALRNGDYRLALEVYERAIRIDPNIERDLDFHVKFRRARRRAEAMEYIEHAERMLADGEYRAALEIYNRALSIAPNIEDEKLHIKFQRARRYKKAMYYAEHAEQMLANGEYRAALEVYNRALSIAPSIKDEAELYAKYQYVKRCVEIEERIEQLVDEATAKMNNSPSEALQILNVALAKADFQGIKEQMGNIRILIERVKTRVEYHIYKHINNLFNQSGFIVEEINKDELVLVPRNRDHPQSSYGPIYTRLILNSSPVGDDFTDVCNTVKSYPRDNITHRLAIVVSDQRPEPWSRYRLYEIHQREGMVIVPLDISLFDQLEPNRTPADVFTSEIDQATGQQNLYSITGPVSSDLSFFGRERVLQQIIDLLSARQPVGLFGLRKVGKTSLIQRLQGRLTQQWSIALVDVQSISLHHGIWSLYPDIIAAFADHLQRYRPDVDLPDLHLCPEVPTPSPALADAFMQDMRALHAVLGAPDEGKRLLLIMDEIDRLLPVGEAPGYEGFTTLFGQLRAANQQARMLDFLVVGVDAAVNRVERWPDHDNELYRALREVWMPPMTHDDVCEMIESLGSQMGVRYESEALHLLAGSGGGQPFVTRQLCSRAIQDRLGQGAITVTVEQARGAIEEFIFGDPYLREMWDKRLDDAQREMLRALAQASEPLPRLDLLPTSQRQGALAALGAIEDYTLVNRADGGYTIAWDVFKKWIRWIELGLED